MKAFNASRQFVGTLAACLSVQIGATAQAAPEAPSASTSAIAYAIGGGLENVQLSPDGTRVAGMVRTVSGLRALVSRKVDGSDQQIAYHLKEPGMNLRLVRWLGNERFLLRVSNNQELVNGTLPLPITRLVVIGIDGEKPVVLTDVRKLGWSNQLSHEAIPACPGSALVQLPSVGDGASGNLVLGRFDAQAMRWLSAPTIPAGSQQLFADAKGQVRLVLRRPPGGGAEVERLTYQETSRGTWKPWKPKALEAALRVRELGLTAAGDAVEVLADLNETTSEVWRLPLSSDLADAPPQRLLTIPTKVDQFSVLRNAQNCEAVALRANGKLWAWGDDLDRLQGGIAAQLPDQTVDLLAWQGDRYLARMGSAKTPTEYLIGTRSTKQLQGLGGTHVNLPVELPLRQRTLTLADGVGEVTILSAANAKGPQPTVICLDCQLHYDDQQGAFAPLHAYWAQQGWSVVDAKSPAIKLEDSFRATPESLRRWRSVIQGLIAQGETLPGQVVAIGMSSEAGRQALLLGAEPGGLVQGVVTLGGLTDLPSYFGQIDDPSLGASYRAWLERSAQGLSASDQRQLSPVHRAADLRAAVLLIHADHDAVVNVAQAQAMHQALQAHQPPSSLLVLKNSSEQVDFPPYRMDVMKAIDRLLAAVRSGSRRQQAVAP